MADRLPPEILSLIADCAHDEAEDSYHGKPLIEPGATDLRNAAAVCWKWKAAFDPFAYKYFDLQSTNLYPWGLHKSNLSVFEARTSGAIGVSRRIMVRGIDYNIKIEYRVPNKVTTQKLSSIQTENDHAYRFSVAGLFEILKTWDNSCRLVLGLLTEYGSRPKQPAPTELDASQSYFESLGTIIAIPDLYCVDTLYLESNENIKDDRQLYAVSASAFLEVAHHCTGPRTLNVHLRTASFPVSEPKHHRQKQRYAIAIGLCSLPSSLRTFNFIEHTFISVGFPLVLSQNEYLFATNLRSMSVQLRHLELFRARLPPDFLLPLDGSDKPIQNTLHWPNLESVKIHQAPTFTGAGETELVESEVLDESISPDPEYLKFFNRAFISIAHAAREMPRLATFAYTNIDYCCQWGPPDDYPIFSFTNDRATRTITVQWISITGYKPGKRVANAWGFRLSDMTVKYDGPKVTSRIELSVWPPTKT